MMNLMKKILCAVGFVVMACSTAFGSVAIDAANFPDTVFRSYISANFDSNSDGTLSDAEIAKARIVGIQGKGAMNLAGIENLTALRLLACDFSLAGNEFNYTNFKAAYGLTCEIDDSYLLMIYSMKHHHENDKLTTPMIGDVKDTSTGDYILRIPLYDNSDILYEIAFRTRGTLNTEVHVFPY